MKKIGCLALIMAVLTFTSCVTTGSDSALVKYDYSELQFLQLEPPAEGQMMAVIETSLGTIKAVLYPEQAPNYVDNFVNRVNEGFYDNKEIYLVEKDVCFLTGAANENFNSGVTSDGKLIPNEYSVKLWPFRGALMGYSRAKGSADSRFAVLDSQEFTDELAEIFGKLTNDAGEQVVPSEVIEAFRENEAVAIFTGYYTIFGQTIEGFDVIDSINAAICDEKTLRPTDPIFINKIEITEFHAG